MQLDLFSDNRRTIRLNDADGLLRALRLEEAIAVYDELLADAPEDAELLSLRGLVALWRKNLTLFHAAPVGSARLHHLWRELTPEMPPALATALRRLLIDELGLLPIPELIYLPPRFHIGTLLLAAGRFAEAEHWLARALDAGIGERGRFLAWRGDALTKLGDPDQAKGAYIAAFLEGPHEVDLVSLQSPLIHDLLGSLESEDQDFGAEDLPAWLPVWGWLQGAFGLPLNEPAAGRTAFVAALEAAHSSRSLPTPRLWFDDLRYAEYLRTVFRDDRELVRVRRRMRQLCGFMFERYMERMRGPVGDV
ncbi:MAG: tetratricopeptide repeat protein [Desulfuromonadales bacterium]